MPPEVIDITQDVFLPNYIKQSLILLDGLLVPHLSSSLNTLLGMCHIVIIPTSANYYMRKEFSTSVLNTLLQLGPPLLRLCD